MFGQDYHPWTDRELLQGFKRLVKQDGVSARFCFFVDGLDEFDSDPAVLIPPDLEDLYDKMLNSFDAFYLEHASQFFQLVRASYRPISLLCMSFADEEDPMYAIDAEIKTLTDEEKLLRCEETRRRLNSRCKGLLEVPMGEVWKLPRVQENPLLNIPHRLKQRRKGQEISTTERITFAPGIETQERPEKSDMGDDCAEELGDNASVHQADGWETDSDSSSEGEDSSSTDIRQRLLCVDVAKMSNLKIEYLHRTVKDYLEREEVWSQLLEATSPSFNPHLSLCRASLLLLKVQRHMTLTDDNFWNCIMDYLNYASTAEADTLEAEVSLIDEIGRVADTFDTKGVQLAARARIAPIVVDKVEQVELSILTRLKQENVTLGAASWHEQYYTTQKFASPSLSIAPATPPVSSDSQANTSIDRSPSSILSPRLASPYDILPPEWKTPDPLNEEIEITEVPLISEPPRGRTEQQELYQSASPSPSPSRSRSQSVGLETSQAQQIDVPARWRTPRKVTRNFTTQWPGTHPDVELSCTFDCFVTFFSLPLYLKKKLGKGDVALRDRERRSFLDYLVMRDMKNFSNRPIESAITPPNFVLVKMALEGGADPNQKYGDATPWQNLLKRARESTKAALENPLDRSQVREFGLGRWADIVELFIKHGANPSEVQNSLAANAIRDIFGEWDVLRTKKLEKLVKNARQSPSLKKLWPKD